jgi:hypothetical protein
MKVLENHELAHAHDGTIELHHQDLVALLTRASRRTRVALNVVGAFGLRRARAVENGAQHGRDVAILESANEHVVPRFAGQLG